jgi:superfamily II RNA helicase
VLPDMTLPHPAPPQQRPTAVRTLGERLVDLPANEQAGLATLLDWATESGTTLYDHQEEAILALAEGHHVVLATPTGSGKSLVALASHFLGAVVGDRSFYTSPIKALVSEKFFALCKELGPERVGLMTGDATVNRDATVICCTAEVLAQLALQEGEAADVQRVVIDEFHYYADRDRGMAWQIPLLALPQARFVLMSATLGDTSELRQRLTARTGRACTLVESARRPVPLRFEWRETPLHETVSALVGSGRAPCYIVHPSQRLAAETAQEMTSHDLVPRELRRKLAERLNGVRFASPYGPTLKRLLGHGIGLHHAGLLPMYRLLVEQLAQEGLLPILCGTDTLGVGINLPLKTVVLTQLCKFDGEHTRLYQVREFQQLAGRAGRKGFDDEGWVVAQAPEHVIHNKRMEAKLGRDGKPVKFQRAQPPQRGYVPWTAETFGQLQTRPPEPLLPVFEVTPGMLMSLCKSPRGVRRLAELIGRSHLRPHDQLRERRRLAVHARALQQAGVLAQMDGDLRAAAHLQDDFSLHHTLSLWLVEALDALARQHAEESGDPQALAWDAVSLAEAVLENPGAVLQRQVSQEKQRVLADLKAQGVPFEERGALLDEVTWPKPLAEWIYTHYNSFAEQHPWLGGAPVRPKSVVRGMAERWCTFAEYVRELDLASSEGVLLRYLTQAYKTLVQNVPDDRKSDELLAVLGYLRAAVAVDASLLTEWERLRGHADMHADALPELPPRPPVAGLDAKAREATLRAVALERVRLLCERDFELAGVAEADVRTWEAEHGALVWLHELRLRGHAQLRRVGEDWELSQRVVGQHDDGQLVLTFDADNEVLAAVLT